MAKQILIDLEKFRSTDKRRSDEVLPELMFRRDEGGKGLISIREWASFQYSCRRCTAAPCIDACPAEALEKDEDGMIVRAPNLCISCKSCVVICPFGTLMNDFFSYHRNREQEYDLRDEKELELFIKSAPEGAVTLTDGNEDPEKHIYRLTANILVRERTWDNLNHQ